MKVKVQATYDVIVSTTVEFEIDVKNDMLEGAELKQEYRVSELACEYVEDNYDKIGDSLIWDSIQVESAKEVKE
jgi:hypothetical protein